MLFRSLRRLKGQKNAPSTENKPSTFVDEVFGGTLESQVTCHTCHMVSLPITSSSPPCNTPLSIYSNMIGCRYFGRRNPSWTCPCHCRPSLWLRNQSVEVPQRSASQLAGVVAHGPTSAKTKKMSFVLHRLRYATAYHPSPLFFIFF
mgnify:FL=1